LNGHINQPLKATIKYVSLKDKPSYLALSFVWSDPTTKPLLLDGRILQITASLEQAIGHLMFVDKRPVQIPSNLNRDGRRPASPGTYILHLRDYIWVDTICIKQQDNVEKSLQVQLMRKIFQKANAVIIWLGWAKDNSDTVMKCIQEVGSEIYDSILRASGGTERIAC
jgi:hypothetical protein